MFKKNKKNSKNEELKVEEIKVADLKEKEEKQDLVKVEKKKKEKKKLKITKEGFLSFLTKIALLIASACLSSSRFLKPTYLVSVPKSRSACSIPAAASSQVCGQINVNLYARACGSSSEF